MASTFYNGGMAALLSAGSPFLSTTVKCILVATATPYTFNKDDDFVDESGANDVIDAEVSVSGYTGGFAGAGRKTLASKTVTADDTNDWASLDAADFTGGTTWSALGAGETIEAAVFVEEITNDAASRLLIYLDPGNLATNGSDMDLSFHANGLGTVAT